MTAPASTLRLRQIREDRNLSRLELAVLSNTSEATIVRAERGDISPKLSSLHAWAHALECTVTDLIGEP